MKPEIGRGGFLTKRQLQVARFVACGFGRREIAHRLNISHFTVDHIRLRAMERLGVRSFVEVIVAAWQKGLIP